MITFLKSVIYLINVTESLQLEPTKEILCCSMSDLHIHFKTVTLRENCLWFELTVVRGCQIAVIILCLLRLLKLFNVWKNRQSRFWRNHY